MNDTPSQSEPEQAKAPSDMTRRTLGGFFWMSAGAGAQALVQVATLAVLARLLTPEDFGLVAAALVVIGFSAIFSQLGIGPAIVQRLELTWAHVRAGFTLTLLLGFGLAGLLCVLAPVVAAFFQRDELSGILRVLALVFPVQALGVVAESVLQRELRFRLLATLELIAIVIGLAGVGITLAFLGWGVWSLVAAHLAQNAVKTALLVAVQPHPKSPSLDRAALRDLTYFGGGFTLARISNYLAGHGDNLVVGRWLGALALGIYAQAHYLMTAPASLFGQVLDRVLFPAMARVQDRQEKLAAAYRRGIALIALVMLPASGALMVLAPEVVLILLGPQWSGVVLPLQILAAGMLFRTSYKISDSLVRATGAVYRRAWRQAIYATLIIGGAIVGQSWGLAGVAVGVLVALTGNFLLMAHLSLQLTGLSWRTFAAAHGPGAALAVCTGAFVFVAAGMLREAGAAPIVVVMGALAAALPIVVLLRLLPKIFLGADGIWMFQRLAFQRTLPSPLCSGERGQG